MRSNTSILPFFLFCFLFSCQTWDLEKYDITCSKTINLAGNLDFGNVTIGTDPSPTINLRITNSGNCPLHIFELDVPEGYSYSFSGDGTIQSNQFLDIDITFTPLQVGTYNGIVSINSDATSGIATIAVSGIGIDPGVGGTGILSVSGDIDFGQVQLNSTVSKTLLLTNTGDNSLTVNNIQINNSVFSLSASTPFNLDKNQSKQISIQMNTSSAGQFNGKISVFTSANNKEVSVSGEVLGSPFLTISGDADFDTVLLNSVVNKAITLSNTGTATLTVDNISTETSRFTISGATFPFEVVNGQSQSISVGLNTSVAGTYSENITILNNAGAKIIPAKAVVISNNQGSSCPSTFTDSRDGQIYSAKAIAGKCWMTVNLRYDTPTAGDDTPYNNNASYLQEYGRYYSWNTLMNNNPNNSQGVCPVGWHVPSKSEFNTLLTYYGQDGLLAYSSLIDGGSSGLNFKLGGHKSFSWIGLNQVGTYWTTSSGGVGFPGGSWAAEFNVNHVLQFVGYDGSYLLSCRCVKD